MVTYSRRAAIASSIALLAGCSGRTGSPRSDTDPSATATGANTTASQPATNGTGSDDSEEPIPEPDERLSYGETLLDGSLGVTVETLRIQTAVMVEPHTTVDLPDGEAVAVAPVTFTNRHETETIFLFAPNFVLVGSELRQEETRSIQHPESGDPIFPRDLTRFDDPFLRWSFEGSRIDPGQSVDTVAMFEVPEGTTTEDVAVVYDSSTWSKYVDDLYGTTIARWMDST